MRDRTASIWDGDRLLTRAASIMQESRFLLADLEELLTESRELRRHSLADLEELVGETWELRRRSQEIRAALRSTAPRGAGQASRPGG
jgi:hypothetical protein